MKKLLSVVILSGVILTSSLQTSEAAKAGNLFNPSYYNLTNVTNVSKNGDTVTFTNPYDGDFSIDFSKFDNVVSVNCSSTGFNIIYRNPGENAKGFMVHWN
jgi:hypothetical protein